MSIKNYNKIIIPAKFNTIIDNKTIEISKEYSKWVLSIKDERINYLKKYLKSYNISLNCTEKSLKELFIWFSNNIEFREQTKEELKKYEKFRDVIVNTKTFSAETVSLIFDIALFWGECLISRKKNIDWSINSVEKGDVNYAFPLIADDEDGGLNSRQLIEVVAYKIMDKTPLKDEFNNLLDIWIDMV